jgi:hypothetical protein
MNNPKRPKPARGEAYGILNPWGDLWTHDTFQTEALARKHIEDFWRNFPSPPTDLSRFKVIRVKVTVSALQKTRPSEAAPKASPPGAQPQAEHREEPK